MEIALRYRILAVIALSLAMLGMAFESPLLSPRLRVLAAEIKAGDRTALGRFWGEVSARGTPIEEPIERDPSHVWVTFLYHGGVGISNVVVFVDHGMWGDIASLRMERLDESDVWYKTLRMRRDARFTYELGVNDPLTSIRGIQSASVWIKRSSGWCLDPLNPRKFPAYPRPLSVVELSGAPPQLWNDPRPGVPRGEVQSQRIKSKILANERTVWVYTPHGYDVSDSRFGTLILFDGGAYNSWVPTPTILDNLAAAERVPPLIAALVAPPDPLTRDLELACSEQFTRFLADELMPWLSRTFRISADPALVVIGGSSYGGLAATYAAFRRPEIFGNVLSQSAPFMFSPPEKAEPGWLIRGFSESPRLAIRFHLDVGLMEVNPAAEPGQDMLTSNRNFRDVLLSKGSWVHYQEFNGGHEYLNWRGTLADGLVALLGDRVGRSGERCP